MFSKYFFLFDIIVKIFKYISINNYFIELVNNKWLFYTLIYNLGLIWSKTLKIYIKLNLISKFVKFFKLLVSNLILFIRKKDRDFYLNINY